MNPVVKYSVLAFMGLVIFIAIALAYMFQTNSWPGKGAVSIFSGLVVVICAVISFFMIRAKT